MDAIILSSDINECEEMFDNCDSDAQCIDTIGSYNCECYDGYEGDGFNCSSMLTLLGTNMHHLTCIISVQFVDINECIQDLSECDNNAQCTDTIGSYNCTCNSGYEGSGFTCTSKFCTNTTHWTYTIVGLL